MVVSKHGPQCAVDSRIIKQGIQVPTLNRCLRTHPTLASWAGIQFPIRAWLAVQSLRVGRTVKDLFRRRRSRKLLRRLAFNQQASSRVNSPNNLLYFFWTERSIFVVEAVTGTIRGGHIELDQVDVLPQDVSRSTHLEVVHQIVIGHQIGMPVFHYVSRIGAEE